jgi:hypothetical protein
MLRLRSISEDESTHEFFAVIKFRDIYGCVRCVQLPLAELKHGFKAVEKLHTNAGAYCSDDESLNLKALRTLKNPSDKVARRKFAPALGWYGTTTTVSSFAQKP